MSLLLYTKLVKIKWKSTCLNLCMFISQNKRISINALIEWTHISEIIVTRRGVETCSTRHISYKLHNCTMNPLQYTQRSGSHSFPVFWTRTAFTVPIYVYCNAKLLTSPRKLWFHFYSLFICRRKYVRLSFYSRFPQVIWTGVDVYISWPV